MREAGPLKGLNAKHPTLCSAKEALHHDGARRCLLTLGRTSCRGTVVGIATVATLLVGSRLRIGTGARVTVQETTDEPVPAV